MTTNFDKIIFNPEYHTYTLNGQKLTSATRYTSQFLKPFDSQGIAERVARKQGKLVTDVLNEWAEKANASRQLGNRVHAYIKNTICKLDPPSNDDPFLALNTKTPEETAFDELWQSLDPTIRVHAVEFVIGDQELGVAGTVDSLFYSPDTQKHHVWDWKTGKFDVDNPFENLLSPFDGWPASKLHIYSLQVSLYRLILERNTDLDMGDSYLVHLSSQGAQIHKGIEFNGLLLSTFK